MRQRDSEYTLIDYKPRGGVNPSTAIAILVLAGLSSAGAFFSIAQAMLPDRSRAAALIDDAPAQAPLPVASSPEEVAAAVPLDEEQAPPAAGVVEDDAIEEEDRRPSPSSILRPGPGPRVSPAPASTPPATPSGQRGDLVSDDPLLGAGLGNSIDV